MNQQLDEFGEPVALSAAEAEQYVLQQQAAAATASKPARTWAQYAQYKATAPFESTITAVGISYWLANMLSAGINSRVSDRNRLTWECGMLRLLTSPPA
jgi:hypothetical protein